MAVSAYINPSSHAIAIVAINANTSTTNLPIFISGSAPCTLVPWETSANKNLAQGSGITVSNARVSVTLTGQSVTTFVGMP